MTRNIISLLAASLVVVFASCSKSPSGTYALEGNPAKQLTLTQDGKFLHGNGDSGTYSTEGNSVIMTNPMFGGARGEIKDGKLVFPAAGEGQFVAESFTGTWARK